MRPRHNRRARSHRQVAEALENLCGIDRVRGWAAGPHWTCATQPIDLAKAIGYSNRRAMPRSVRWPQATHCATTPRPLTSTPRSPTPIRCWDSIWRLGSATAQRQTGTPPPERRSSLRLDRLLTSAIRPTRCRRPGQPRGYTSNNNATDTDKVEVLEMAVDRLPFDHPDGRWCSPHCVQNSPTGVLSTAEALADEALVTPHHQVTTPPSQGAQSGLVSTAGAVHARAAIDWTADALVRPSRSVIRYCYFLWRTHEQRPFLGWGHRRDGSLYRDHVCLAEQLDQPTLS